MDNNFLSFASNVLGDTNTGLTGSEIGKYIVEYSMKFKRKIKFDNGNFSEDGKLLSKRDALKENLKCF